MALFGSKKEKAKKVETTSALKPSSKEVAPAKREQNAVEQTKQTKQAKSAAWSREAVLIRPRITEKASDLAAVNAYAFEVTPDATKSSVAAAVRDMYNVDPVKVAVIKIPTKQVTNANKKGVKRGGKKAYVYLAPGQTIEFT